MSLLLPAAESDAQEEKPLPLATVFKAVACYGNLNYDCVVDLLSEIPLSYSGAAKTRMRAVDLPVALEVGRILGVSYLVLGDEEAARETFRWLLSLEESYILSGTEISPAYSRIFFEERATLQGTALGTAISLKALARVVSLEVEGSSQAVARRVAMLPKKSTAPQESSLKLSPFVDVSWVRLSGADAEVFGDTQGIGFGLGVLDEESGLSLELLLGYSAHGVLLDNLLDERQRELTLFHVSGVLGHEWRVGRLGFRPGVGAGVASFGVLTSTEQLASLFSMGHVLTVKVLTNTQLYLRLEGVGLLTASDDVWRSSGMLRSSAGAGVKF